MAPLAKRSTFPLRVLLPAVLGLFLVADLVSRLVPPHRIAFRAWEAVTTRGLVGWVSKLLHPAPRAPLGILEPARHVDIPRAYGDLASMSNRPWMREYHRERFTTDALGFRNVGSPSDPHVGVVVGSSFTVGSTLSDDETLPAQLSAILGGNVYNAGTRPNASTGWLAGDVQKIDRLLDSLKLSPGATLVFEYLEKTEPPLLPQQGAPSGSESGGSLRARIEHSLRLLASVAHIVNEGASLSPFRITLRRWLRVLENDRIFPNSFADLAELAALRNGDQILFSRPERAISEDATRRPELGVPYLRFLSEHLRARGLNFIVVLIPTQYSVYSPLTVEPRPPTQGMAFLATLEKKLREVGIVAVNVGPLLGAAAEKGLSDHHYVYWRDDTHWNKDGVGLAAGAIAASWPSEGSWRPQPSKDFGPVVK